MTLEKAIAGEPRFEEARKQEPVVDRLLTIAHEARGPLPPRLDACGRHRHRRPAARRSLCRSTAIRARRMPVTQFNMKWVEQAGLVKFDFLGLKTLTVLENAVELIRRRGVEIDLAAHPARRRRRPTQMLARGETVGVFQVESAGHAPGARRHAARPLRGPDRARRPLSPGPDGQHPDLLLAQARPASRSTISTRSSSRSSRRPTASSPTRSR